jgi:hypothetical protein
VNGYDAKAIVEKNLGWPNGLCVDMEARKIYWADARTDRIESADLDGSNRKIIIHNVPHVFGVTLYGNYLYWTDWVTRAIMRADKNHGQPRIMLKEKLDAQPMDIKVFTQGRQNCTRTPCYHNGGCSDECAVQNNTKVCLCPEGKILVDGYRCISTPLNEECKNKSDQFVCSDGRIVSTSRASVMERMIVMMNLMKVLSFVPNTHAQKIASNAVRHSSNVSTNRGNVTEKRTVVTAVTNATVHRRNVRRSSSVVIMENVLMLTSSVMANLNVVISPMKQTVPW